MKKTLLYSLCSLALAAFALPAWGQQINGDFTEWENCYPWVGGEYVTSAVGTQPKGWHASNVYGVGGTGKSDKFVAKVSGHADNYTGVQIQNVYVGMKIVVPIGSWAPGYLSLGTPWNTSKGTSDKDGGCFGGNTFTYRPDAIAFNYKYSQSKSKASFVGYLWKGTWNQKNVPSSTTASKTVNPAKSDMTNRDVCVLGKYDGGKHKGDTPTSTGDAELIASYEKYVESSVDTWTPCEIPFVYEEENAIPEKINVIFASSDYFNVTGAGTDGANIEDTRDVLTIDDVRLVYFHSLSSCTYNNQKVVFDANNSAEIDEFYEEGKLKYEKKGVGASVEKSYDEATGILTIAVKGDDYNSDNSSVTTYKIQFKKVEIISVSEYAEDLYVSINGITTDPQSTKVTVQTRNDGKINFVLKNFQLASDDGMLPIGNIGVLGLEKSDDKFAFVGNVQITEGDLEGVNYWLGPYLGEVPLDLRGEFVGDDHLKVAIDIDMSESIGQFINVHLGYTPVVATMAVKEGRQYGTFYAPFAVTLPDGVKAYKCNAMEANGYTLELTPVEGTSDGTTIAAKTAIIVETSNAFSQNFYNFDEDLKLENGNTGYLYGVAEGGKTSAPMGSYVLQTQNGNQKFYKVTDETGDLKIEANRCYLQIPADKAGVKAISFPGDATAIDAVNALVNGKAEIYDLQGRRLQTLQKGVNIVNGRKVMVK